MDAHRPRSTESETYQTWGPMSERMLMTLRLFFFSEECRVIKVTILITVKEIL